MLGALVAGLMMGGMGHDFVRPERGAVCRARRAAAEDGELGRAFRDIRSPSSLSSSRPFILPRGNRSEAECVRLARAVAAEKGQYGREKQICMTKRSFLHLSALHIPGYLSRDALSAVDAAEEMVAFDKREAAFEDVDCDLKREAGWNKRRDMIALVFDWICIAGGEAKSREKRAAKKSDYFFYTRVPVRDSIWLATRLILWLL